MTGDPPPLQRPEDVEVPDDALTLGLGDAGMPGGQATGSFWIRGGWLMVLFRWDDPPRRAWMAHARLDLAQVGLMRRPRYTRMIVPPAARKMRLN